MHYALAVGVPQRVGHFVGDMFSVLEGELALPNEAVAEALALHKWHRVPELPTGIARIQHRQDVGMLKARGRADLTLKPLWPERSRQFGVQHLERNFAVVLDIVG